MDGLDLTDESYIFNVTKDICDSIEEIEKVLVLISTANDKIITGE